MRKILFKGVVAGIIVFAISTHLAHSSMLISDWPKDQIVEDQDSVKRQQQIHEELDLISEEAIPILDQAVQRLLPEFTPLTIEGRLVKIERDVPLSYNEHVQQYIDLYSTDRYRNYLSRMMGLGQYYFNIYDQIFEETGLPAEIRYLSIVESALNPHAVSRVGATGPWQFMFATARMYGLQMDSHIDERKDPIAASYAASRYLNEAYAQFGDWLLAIASYNCGPGNVARAIKRSGLENPDYWQIRSFLPKETRNYVPAFIAMTYMLEYHEEYDIHPADVGFDVSVEVVNVQQEVSLSAIAAVINVEQEFLKTLNPAYKRDLIPGSAESPKRLVLPEVDLNYYPALYAALNTPALEPNKVMYASNPTPATTPSKNTQIASSHRIKKGETLGQIAQKYSVTVQDLRAWNNIKGNRIMAGQRLDLQLDSKTPKKASDSKGEPQYYVVKKGDTLSGIASRHKGSTVSSIRSANGLKNSQIKPGMRLRLL